MEIRKKVLAVDDNSDNLVIMEKILEQDYEVKTAETGEEALQIAQDFQPDLILLDIMLPKMSGYQVCEQLRADSAFNNTTIIMVSAKGMVSERYQGHEAGADDYITKPFNEEELLESISFFLKKGVFAESSSEASEEN